MASQPPVIDESTAAQAATEQDTKQASAPAQNKPAKAPRTPIGQVFRELDWTALILVGLGGGVLWTLLLLQGGALQLLAGLLPVTGGILIGRRVKRHINWHAVMLGVFTALAAVLGLLVIGYASNLPAEAWALVSVGVVTLLPFPAFGVITAARSEERNRAARELQAQRGGKLDRPGRVRSIDELQSLSLPQLGGYVADLFRKHDFLINDYRFEKDRLDFQVSYEGEPWLLRVVTTEKVKPGVAQELAQRMKAEGVKKGVVITSMDFQDGAQRWAKDKPVALIDGQTLLSMND